MAKTQKPTPKDSKRVVTETTKKINDIVIEEDESDVLLSSGFNGDPDELKEEIKKEAEKGRVLSRFLVPLFTFILIVLIAAGLTWYYAKPERENSVKTEDKIQTPPDVTNEAAVETPAPTPTPTPVPEKKEESYTVKEGDTLSSIANAYGLTSSVVAAYNGITDPNTLRIGQVIKIPIK